MTAVAALKDRFGVAPILHVIGAAASTYYGWLALDRSPSALDRRSRDPRLDRIRRAVLAAGERGLSRSEVSALFPRNCKRRQNSAAAEAGRKLGKLSVNLMSIGTAALAQKFTAYCGGCGHKVSLHDRGDGARGNGYATPEQQAPPPAATVPPGWHPDPNGQPCQRWSGRHPVDEHDRSPTNRRNPIMSRLAVAVVALVLALTACGTGSTSAPPSVAPPAAAPTATVALSSAPTQGNDRNNLVKALGQPAYTGCPLGATDPNTCTMQFSLDKITTCPGGGPNHRVLWWTVQTRPTFGTDGNTLVLSSGDLRLIGPDGVSKPVTGEYSDCVADADRFPDSKVLQRSTKYVGGMEITLPGESGTLVLAPPENAGGWEWPLT